MEKNSHHFDNPSKDTHSMMSQFGAAKKKKRLTKFSFKTTPIPGKPTQHKPISKDVLEKATDWAIKRYGKVLDDLA